MSFVSIDLVALLAIALAGGVRMGPHDPAARLAELGTRIERAPTDLALRVERARLALELDDLRLARADVDVALRREPMHPVAVRLLAFVEQRGGNLVAALQACRRAEALGVVDAGVLRLRGHVLASLARPAEAAAAFAAAWAAARAHAPEHALELAQALVATGDDAAALAVLERGLAELGPVVSLVDAAVAIDVRNGRPEEAVRRYDALRPFVQREDFLVLRCAAVWRAVGRTDLAAAATAGRALPAVGALLGPVAPASAPGPRPTPTVLVPTGADWRYLDTGVAPAANWTTDMFDDSGWNSGPAQLGYGDGDEATVIASGAPGAAPLVSWFRHQFVWQQPMFATARVRVLCDDGAVVFVNGVEVGRWNVHNGPTGAWSPGSVAVSGPAEQQWHVFPFDPALLVDGRNQIAVTVHQVSPSSSDVSFDCEVLAGDGPIEVVRGPYLQNGTPSGGVVRWRTDQPCATQLWLGASGGGLQSVFYDATPRTEHAASVAGLPAETTFAYAIGDASGPFAAVAPGSLRTLPPIGAVRPMRVWALGDAGFATSSQHQVRDAFIAWNGATPVDAILMLGDNAYFAGTDREYQNGVFDVYGASLRGTFAWSALGNHDASSANTAVGTGPYYDAFTLPRAGEAGGLPSGTEAYYSFDRGHVHFVCLDSMDSDRSATGAMLTWLAADLAATQARWVVAFFHHPPYSAGSHTSDVLADSGGRMTDMRQVALPVLEAGGVDLVLCGHSHSYERSFLLDGHYGASATLLPTMVLDSGDGRDGGDGYYGKRTAGKASHEGAVYVVAGSAGLAGGGALNHAAMRVGLNQLGSF
ncbi:MAG: metallophosphoesterase, partial [Planctomycetes bacterium]|nr:metallophosphoesterase [Planctomycetota bacterium]